MLTGLRGEDSIAELCRREGIVQNLYYRWSKEFLEAGKKRLAGDNARAATSDEVRPKRALFSDALEELLRDSWERMSRKTGRHQVHRVAGRANGDYGMWWLVLLGLPDPRVSRPYMIESRLGGGAEPFRPLPPAIRRRKG